MTTAAAHQAGRRVYMRWGPAATKTIQFSRSLANRKIALEKSLAQQGIKGDSCSARKTAKTCKARRSSTCRLHDLMRRDNLAAQERKSFVACIWYSLMHFVLKVSMRALTAWTQQLSSLEPSCVGKRSKRQAQTKMLREPTGHVLESVIASNKIGKF